MPETEFPVPENLRGLFEAVQRLRAGEEAREDLRTAKDWLLARLDQVSRALASLPAPPEDAPADQAAAFEEAKSRFEAGLAELEEGLHLVTVHLQEGDPFYLDRAVERVAEGARTLSGVSEVWVELLTRYQAEGAEGA